MGLQQKLDEHKRKFREKAPKEALAVMQRAVDGLSNPEMMSKTVKVGDKAPEFSLTNRDGREVSLTSLLKKGPVVLGFYRGRW